MTPQEVFDKVVARLRDGTGQAAKLHYAGGVEVTFCEYITEDGRKCVVGIFVPDGHPGQAYGGDVHDLVSSHPDLARGVIGDNLAMMEDLQFVHDAREHWIDGAFNEGGELALREVADRYSLVYSEPT